MRHVRWLVILSLMLIPYAYGAETPTHTQTFSEFPQNQASFFRDTQRFLANEDAVRYRLMFPGFAAGWAVPPTSASLSHTTADLEAIVNGFYVFQPSMVLSYAANSRTFVYVDWFNTRLGQSPPLSEVSVTGGTGCTTVTRATRLILVRCAAGSTTPTPTMPGLLELLQVDTSGTGITGVQLRAPTTPLAAALSPIGATSTCSAGEIPKTSGGLWTCASDSTGGAGGSPGGATTQVQFNDAGVFAGDVGLTFNKTTKVLTATGGFSGPLLGNATTASQLATDPGDCAANQYASAINATGTLTCAQVGYTQLTGVPTAIVRTDQANTYSAGAQSFAAASSLTLPTAAGVSPTTNGQMAYDSTSHTLEVGINGTNKTVALTDSNSTGNAATATALAANGANCASGSAPLGVDASGAAEGCVAVASQAALTAHTGAVSGAHAASAVSFTPDDNLTSTNVQAAVAEVGARHHPPVLVATLDDISLSGEQSIDGILTNASSVLVWRQDNATQNGVYTSASGAWLRRGDADTADRFTAHFRVDVEDGVTYRGTSFRLQNTGAVVLGSTDLVFAPDQTLWYDKPLQTVDQEDSLDCTPPTSSPVIGTVVSVISTGGNVSLGTPQILAGLRANQRCLIRGTHATDTIELADAAGVELPFTETSIILDDVTEVLLRWTGTVWRQESSGPSPGTGGGGPTSLQEACDVECQLRNLTEARPFEIAPEGATGPKERRFGVGGNFVTERLLGDGTPAPPDVIRLRPGDPFEIQALLGEPASWQTIGKATNVDGVDIDLEGIFALPDAGDIAYTPSPGVTGENVQTALAEVGARVQWWQLDWSAAGAEVDGTNCTKASSAVVLNSGPRVRPITCVDAAGEIEFNLDTPDRYDGGELTICFKVNDDTFDSTDDNWDAAVIAQFRPSGSAVNNTWSTAVEAATTMAVADASYYACAAVTPDGAAPGVGTLFVKATIDSAGGHDDSNARLLGGYVRGR